jgi:hypothetical protein
MYNRTLQMLSLSSSKQGVPQADKSLVTVDSLALGDYIVAEPIEIHSTSRLFFFLMHFSSNKIDRTIFRRFATVLEDWSLVEFLDPIHFYALKAGRIR